MFPTSTISSSIRQMWISSYICYICILSVKSLTNTHHPFWEMLRMNYNFRRRNSMCSNMQSVAIDGAISCCWPSAVTLSTDAVQVNITNPRNDTQKHAAFTGQLTQHGQLVQKGFVVGVYFDAERKTVISGLVVHHTSLVRPHVCNYYMQSSLFLQSKCQHGWKRLFIEWNGVC